mmetsp:Transcript_73681/g.123060  ORF Transcript_73681/g.123060 Transcript_73681/m.123060 type:complete len:241 (+) Transcript_73681:2-724(+)
MLQLKPLRPFFAGEVVAVAHEGNAAASSGELVYAVVDAAHAGGDAKRPVALRLSTTKSLLHELPLGVFSFSSHRLAPSSGRDGEAGGPCEARSHVVEASGRQERGQLLPPLSEPATGAAAVGSAALVDAVSSVLAAANLPMGLEARQLLERNLKLQEELDAARAELTVALREGKLAVDRLEELKEQNTCQICLSRAVDALLVGCGHLLCRACVPHCNGRCPFCRANFSSAAHFYAPSRNP